MDKNLALEFVRVTEAAAVAAAKWMGRGDKIAADKAAVDAMRKYFQYAEFSGQIVIGEGEKDEAPELYIGEKLGTGKGKAVDIAVDPLENTNATANLTPRAIAVLAAAEKGGLFHAPDMYMSKLIVGHQAVDKVNIDYEPGKNVEILAKALNRHVEDLVSYS